MTIQDAAHSLGMMYAPCKWFTSSLVDCGRIVIEYRETPPRELRFDDIHGWPVEYRKQQVTS